MGYPGRRAANWGLAELAYPAHYRENLLIVVIVETRRGFDNVGRIAAVDGIDMVFNRNIECGYRPMTCEKR